MNSSIHRLLRRMDYNGMQQQQLQQHEQQQQQQELGGQNGGGYQAGYPSMEAPSPQAYSPEQNGGILAPPWIQFSGFSSPNFFQEGEAVVVVVVRDTQISRTSSTRSSG